MSERVPALCTVWMETLVTYVWFLHVYTYATADLTCAGARGVDRSTLFSVIV
jgi:hypothetical protein